MWLALQQFDKFAALKVKVSGPDPCHIPWYTKVARVLQNVEDPCFIVIVVPLFTSTKLSYLTQNKVATHSLRITALDNSNF